MTKARNISDLLDANGDVKSGALDNVPPSNDASALTTGTIDNARISLDANEIPSLDTAKITTGTFADARMPSTVLNSNVDLTNLSASNLTSGTLPDARFPSTLPAVSGANLTNIQGGNNTPNFEIKKTSGQTLSNATWTKVTFQSEAFDSDSAFASDTFTVPSGEGGKYFFYCALLWNGDDRGIRKVALRQNGSTVKVLSTTHTNSYDGASISAGALLDLSASDYIEIYCYQNSQDPETIEGDDNASYFGGFKLL